MYRRRDVKSQNILEFAANIRPINLDTLSIETQAVVITINTKTYIIGIFESINSWSRWKLVFPIHER